MKSVSSNRAETIIVIFLLYYISTQYNIKILFGQNGSTKWVLVGHFKKLIGHFN